MKPPVGAPRELLPRREYPARCYGMINTGTYDDEFNGRPQKSNKVWIYFEIPSEMRVFDETKGKQPKSVNHSLNYVVTNKSKLTLFLESWRGKKFTDEERADFDMAKLIGAPCIIEVGPNEKGTREEIFSIKKLPKHYVDSETGEPVKLPAQINGTKILDFDDWNEECDKTLQWCPEFLREQIISSDEYKALEKPVKPSATEAQEDDEDAPF